MVIFEVLCEWQLCFAVAVEVFTAYDACMQSFFDLDEGVALHFSVLSTPYFVFGFVDSCMSFEKVCVVKNLSTIDAFVDLSSGLVSKMLQSMESDLCDFVAVLVLFQ